MATNKSDLMQGFIDEVQEYLPKILSAIDLLEQETPERADFLEAAHRYAHIIKGAAPMVGREELGKIALHLYNVLEGILAGHPVDTKLVTALRFLTRQVELCLGDNAATGELLNEATRVLAESGFEAGAYKLSYAEPIDENDEEVLEAPPDAPSTDDEWDFESSMADMDFEDDDDDDLEEEDDDLEDVSAQLLEAFELEAEEHLGQVSFTLNRLLVNPGSIEFLDEVRRSVHTIKGAAGTVGQLRVAKLSHRAEDLLEKLCDSSLTSSATAVQLLASTADMLEDLVGSLSEQSGFDDDLTALYQQYDVMLKTPDVSTSIRVPGSRTMIPAMAKVAPPTPISVAATATPAPADKLEPVVFASLPGLTPSTAIDQASTASRVDKTIPAQQKMAPPSLTNSGPTIRVPLEGLDELVKVVSEVVVNRSSFQEYFSSLIREAAELRLSASRLRGISDRLQTDYEASALGSGTSTGRTGGLPLTTIKSAVGMGGEGFDELEFDRYTEFHLRMRELTETMSDLDSITNGIGSTIGDFDTALNRMGRLSSEMQGKLMHLRMVPFATVATRFSRTVRVTASQLGKQAVLSLEGEQVELDKGVLDDLSEPLLHLLRNAVDHGIESAEIRAAMGKNPMGEVRLSATYEGAQVVIRIHDNGGGFDVERIRKRAIDSGMIPEAQALELNDEALYNLAFLPGFSTAAKVTQISGRGVGLDIVRTSILRMKGTISLTSKPGQETTFTIRLPMTLAVTRGLLVSAAGEKYIMPMENISQLLQTDSCEIGMAGEKLVLRHAGKVLPVIGLAQTLGFTNNLDIENRPLLIVNAGGDEFAVVVDSLHGGREVAVKRLGSHLRSVRGVSAATLMGDGSVVLILNPNDLTESARQEVMQPRRRMEDLVGKRRPLEVMIVDDSLSVRRVVSNLVRNMGWEPTLARDGVEALETLASSARPPDVMLLDIEMPRMDGYELAAAIREDKRYCDIPIIMLTSRAGSKHRDRAAEIGVNEYLVKPYKDAELIAKIGAVTQEGFLANQNLGESADVTRV